MYTQEIKLHHDEMAAKVNTSTGEVIPVKKYMNNIPPDKEIFEPTAKFAKNYTRTWKYLKLVLTDIEYRIVHEMTLRAKIGTNSLEPLSDNISIAELAEKFNINRRTAAKSFPKLKSLGVYAEVKVTTIDGDQHFWILNPYIAFNGRVINKTLIDIFDRTIIGINFKKST